MDLYSNKSGDARTNAQRNLMGRTHYVDPDTLRYHKSRVLSARHTDGGLLFAITTSDALDYQNTRRGYRYAIFDLFGCVIDRPDLEHAFKTSKAAEKAMWAALDKLNAKALTLAAIRRAVTRHTEDMNDLSKKVAAL